MRYSENTQGMKAAQLIAQGIKPLVAVLLLCLSPAAAHGSCSESGRAAARFAEAQLFATMHSILGATYPWTDFERIETLTDAADECPAPAATAELREARRVASAAAADAMRGIASLIDTAAATPGYAGRPIVVFNPSGAARTDVVEANVEFDMPVEAFGLIYAHGVKAVFQLAGTGIDTPFTEAVIHLVAEDVPAAGYRVLYPVAAKEFPVGAVPARLKGTWVENELYRIEAHPAACGGLRSIYARKPDKEFLEHEKGAAAGNDILAAAPARDAGGPAGGDQWLLSQLCAAPKNISLLHGAAFDRIVAVSNPASVKTKSSPLPGESHEALSTRIFPEITRMITTYRNPSIRRIDFHTYLDAADKPDVDYRALFPLTVRNVSLLTGDRITPGPAEWIEYGPGRYIDFTDDGGKVVISYPLSEATVVTPDDDVLRRMATELAESMAGGGITADVISAGPELEMSGGGLAFSIGAGRNNSFTNRILESATHAERNTLRAGIDTGGAGALFVDLSGRLTSRRGPSKALIIEAADRDSLWKRIVAFRKQIDGGGNIELPVGANASGHIAVRPEAGFAFLNSGDVAAHGAENSVLSLSLKGGEEIETVEITGAKTTVRYSYAAIPHAGDWRSAALVRHGLEYNHPLIAVTQATPVLRAGSLPLQLSFISTGDPDIVITSMKPHGTRHDNDSNRSGTGSGVMASLFNTSGDASCAEIEFFIPVESVHDNGSEIEISPGGSFFIDFQPHEKKWIVIEPADKEIDFIAPVR